MPTPYWKRLIYEAWVSTWELVVGQPLARLLILAAIIMTTVIVYRRWKRIEDYWSALRGSFAFVLSSAAFFALIFIGHILVITPKRIVYVANSDKKKAESAAKQASDENIKLRGQAGIPTVKLDMIDAEGRKELEQTKRELEAAKQALQALQSNSDSFTKPANEPLVAATATITLDVMSDSPSGGEPGINMGAGAGAAFIRRTTLFEQKTEALVIVSTINNQVSDPEPGVVRYRFICDALNPDSPSIDKPISELSDSTAIQIEFAKDLIKDGMVVTGEIAWVLNKRVSLKFKIPRQSVEAGRVFVTELNKGLEPLRN